jgi:hypothetical protein
VEPKLPDMPQYLPIQPVPSRNEHPIQPNTFPPYGQFPSTYPYNALNPQFFVQNLPQNLQPAHPATVNPSAGMYAPIPFVGQPLHPGMQNVMTYPSNGSHLSSHAPSNSSLAVEAATGPTNREGLYADDVRNVKRAKIEPKRFNPLNLNLLTFSNSNRA